MTDIPTTYAPPSDDYDSSSSTKDTAQTQAKHVGGTAKEEAGAVADTAKEQAQAVAADVRAQTRQLADDTRDQLSDHAVSQRDRIVDNLRSMGHEFTGMAQNANGSGLAVQLAKEGGEMSQKVADFLAERDPGQLLEELRDLARRRPGAFLIGAAVAGLVAGRATRGVVSAHQGNGSTAQDIHSGTGDPLVSTTLANGSTLQPENDAWGPASSTYASESTTGQPEVLP